MILKPLSRIERRALNAVRRDSGTRDIEHLRNLKMSMEIWYRVQGSLVDKGYANWTEPLDFTDGRAGEQTDVITPGEVSITALGREALKANTFPKRVCRAMAREMPKVVWLVVTAFSGVVTGAAGTLLAQWLSRT